MAPPAKRNKMRKKAKKRAAERMNAKATEAEKKKEKDKVRIIILCKMIRNLFSMTFSESRCQEGQRHEGEKG